MKYCMHCGAEMPDEAEFCTKCGKAGKKVLGANPTKKPLIIGCSIGIVLVSIIVVSLFVTGVLGGKDEAVQTSADVRSTQPASDIETEKPINEAVSDDKDTEKSIDESSTKENAGEAVIVNNTVTSDYFESAKLSRKQTRAKNKETLMELVNSKSASEAQKEKAMNEIVAMTAVIEKETATENLLAAKGFEEVVVTIVDDSVDVIVNAEKLNEQQIAQIEDVVKRKTECASDKIVISPVGKKDITERK